MSTIDKMLIKGIRSFSPDNVNVIEFYRPLTLIVGHNGAGKTTIIECLQQACTGTLPPNSGKGQHWILHPKVAGETEVKAQIKLRFRTATSQPVVIIRTFQLTQKKTALQFKAVDQSLQTYNKDTFEKQALSYRCSDIDRLVPQAMGVSKAVLENVVFVHQEDSNWPLADGQTLKKKFDDIFNATKYTKALEALRKLKNEKAADVKLLTLEKTNLNTLKDTAARFRDDVRTQGEALEEKEGHRRHLQEEMKVAKAQMDTISTQLERFTGFDDEMRHLEMQQEMVAKQLAAMQTRLEAQEQGDALEGTSLEDVEDWLREFEENQNQSGTYQKLLQVKSQILSLRQTMAARREEQERLLPRQGTLQAEADAHSRQLVDRDQFMRDAAQETGLLQLPPGGTLPVDTVAQFSRALAAKLQDLSVQLREVKDNNRRRDEEKGALIDGVRQDIQNHDLEQSNKHKRLREGEDKARQLNQQLSSISVNQLALASFARREEECKSSLDKERERLHRLDVDVQLRTLSAAAEADKHKIDQLRQERAQLAAAGEALTRLGLKREALQQKQERIQRLVEAQHSNLEQVLKRADLPEPDQLSALVQQAVRTAQEELNARQAELNVAKQNLSSKGAVLSETQSQLSSKEQELQQAQMQLSTQLRAVVQEDAVQQPLTNVVNTLEQKRVQQHNQKARLDSMTTMVTHNKTHAQEHKECHTCGRRLAEGREMDDFFSRQDQTLSAVPSQKARLETSMNKLKTQLQTLKNLQPLSLRADALKERELPVLRKKAAELQAEVVQLEGRESELADCMVAVSVDAKVASDVQRDVAWPLTRLLGEVQDIKRDITQLEADLQQGTGQRTLQDVDADMEEAEASKGEQEGKRDQLVLRRDRMRETISGFTAQLHKAQADLMQACHQLQRRTDVEKQLGELQAAGTRLRDELAQQQGAKQPLLDKLHTYQSERESARSADAQVVSQHESRLQEMQTLEIRFRQMSGAIEVYTQEAKADKLQKIKQDLDNCRRKLEKAEQNLQAALTEQAKLENAEQDAEIERRNLKSLLEFKHLEKEQDNRVARMQDIARQKGQAGSREALHQEWVALSGQNQAKRTEADMLSGAIQTLLMNVERAQQGLAAPNLQDIDKKFMHKQVEVETTRMAVNDLDKYHKALEKALLAYHTTKMQDINKVIKELWQKTYRNQDIDMIQIKADADGVRSYNYRVVMNASGAELDMRSRCSAGQKVLACLIIRLALAETFCLNCGILALDEPTTNLDADNSQSLAEALRSIMEARRAQENFQLIVITHDEKFAQLIGTRGHAEYRFRITKDDQQHSLITKEPILE